MKKIHVEIYPTGKDKDFNPKYLEFTYTKLFIIFILIGVSVFGFFFFDYSTLKSNIFNGQLDTIKANNTKLEHTIASTQGQIDQIKKNLYSINKINQKVNALAGRDSLNTLVNGEHFDSLALPKKHYKIFNLKNSFLSADSFFKKNPIWKAAVPVIHPLKKEFHISNYYANNLDPFTGNHLPHLGIDYVSSIKDTVIATGGGYVVDVDQNDLFGKHILIHHTKEVYSFYAHLNRTLIKKGKRVRRGQTIGLLGNSGRSSGPHLHYEVRINKKRVNPLHYILSDLPN